MQWLRNCGGSGDRVLGAGCGCGLRCGGLPVGEMMDDKMRGELLQKEHDIMAHEFTLSLGEFITLEGLQEEIRLLADSMSTHKAFAEKMGISPQYLHDILRGKRLPGKKVLLFLDVKAVLVYQEVR